MANLEEEAYELLDRHSAVLIKHSENLRDDLIKLHKDKCPDKTYECEQNFLEDCLIGLKTLLAIRNKIKERSVDPKLN